MMMGKKEEGDKKRKRKRNKQIKKYNIYFDKYKPRYQYKNNLYKI